MKKTDKKTNKHFYIHQKTIKKINQLKKSLGLKSDSEVIEHVINYYENKLSVKIVRDLENLMIMNYNLLQQEKFNIDDFLDFLKNEKGQSEKTIEKLKKFFVEFMKKENTIENTIENYFKNLEKIEEKKIKIYNQLFKQKDEE